MKTRFSKKRRKIQKILASKDGVNNKSKKLKKTMGKKIFNITVGVTVIAMSIFII